MENKEFDLKRGVLMFPIVEDLGLKPKLFKDIVEANEWVKNHGTEDREYIVVTGIILKK